METKTDDSTSDAGAVRKAPARPPIHQGAITSCAFLGGPEALATGSVEGAVVIWEVEAGAPSQRIEAHAGPVTALAWDARHRRVVSGGHDRRIVFSDPDTGAAAMRLEGCEGGLFALAISPDGEVLASGGYDQVIRLWRLADGASLGVLAGHLRAVTDLDFLDDGRLASCGRDNQVIIWNLARRAELCRTAGHARWAMRVRAAGDGEQVYSAGEDGQVFAWNARTGTQVWRHRLPSPVWGLEQTADGEALIVGMGGGVLRFDLGPGGVAAVNPVAPETARIMARTDTGLVALGADTLMLYRPDAPEAPLRRLDLGAQLTRSLAAIRRSPAQGDVAAIITRHHGQVAFDVAGIRRAVQPSHAGLAFASCAVDESLFATTGFDGQIHLRRAADGGHVRSMDHQGFIFTVCASADGTRLLTAGNDRLALWEVATGRRLWAGENLGVGFHCWATLAPDGGYALMVGEDQALHRWTFSDGAPKRERLDLDTDRLIGTCGLMGVAVLDDQHVALASAAGEVHRAELATGRTTLLHAVHESGVRVLSVSPDRRWLLSFSENCVAALWDLAADRPSTPADMASAVVPGAAFTLHGDLVWIDGEAALHVLSPEALAARAA